MKSKLLSIILTVLFLMTGLFTPREIISQKNLPFSEVFALYGSLCQFPSLLTQAALSSLPRQAKKESPSKGRRNFDFFFMILSMGLLAGFVFSFHGSCVCRIKEVTSHIPDIIRTGFDVFQSYLRKLLKLVCLGMGGGAGFSVLLNEYMSRRHVSSAIFIL